MLKDSESVASSNHWDSEKTRKVCVSRGLLRTASLPNASNSHRNQKQFNRKLKDRFSVGPFSFWTQFKSGDVNALPENGFVCLRAGAKIYS